MEVSVGMDVGVSREKKRWDITLIISIILSQKKMVIIEMLTSVLWLIAAIP